MNCGTTLRTCFTLVLLTSGKLLATIIADPDSLVFQAQPGSTTPINQNSTLRNTGAPASFTCSTSAPFSVSPTSGQLNQNQQINLTVSFNPSGFPNGATGNGAVICGGGGSSAQISLGFAINGAEITLSQSSVQLTAAPGEKASTQITVTTVGGGNTQISVTKQTGAGWLTITQGSGNTPSSITINADAAGLTPGTLNGSLVVSCTGNLPCVPKAASISFTITPNAPVLSVNPAAFSFSAVIGTTTTQSTVVNLRNDGLPTNYTITAQSTPAWLTVTPASGSIGQNQTVQLTVRGNPSGLTAPTYSGILSIASTLAVPLTIRVDFNIQGGSVLSLDQPALSFNANIGSTLAQSAQVKLTNGGGSSIYAASPQVPASWLSINPSNGNIGAGGNQTLTVTVNASGLAAGVYNSTVNVGLGGNVAASFTVKLMVSTFSVASSADGTAALSPGTIASIFLESDVTNTTQVNTNPQLPLEIAGVSVTIRDSKTGLFFISPRQINFLVPEDAATGSATIAIVNPQGTAATRTVQIVAVGPSLYTADATGTGPPAALVLYYDSPTSFRDFTLAASCDSSGRCTPLPIDLRRSPLVILQLYGTGIRNRTSLSNVSVNMGGSVFPVDYAGPQLQFPGLDQVNITLPISLAARGMVSATLIVDGIATKPVQVAFQ